MEKYVCLADIGYPHYYLWEDGTLLNLCTRKYSYPNRSDECALYDINGKNRNRLRRSHLVSFMFTSPRYTCHPGFWANMGPIGFSKYEITWEGKVYSLSQFKYLIGNISFDGYYRVCMFNDMNIQRTEVISRLVAKMFIPNPYNKPEVNHIDGDKSNNCIYNLEWVYGWENVEHALKHNLRKSSLTDDQIHKICKRLEEGNTVTSIMEEMNIPKHAVLGIKSGCHNRIAKDYNIPHNKHF